jgi:hypothetical protein
LRWRPWRSVRKRNLLQAVEEAVADSEAEDLEEDLEGQEAGAALADPEAI